MNTTYHAGTKTPSSTYETPNLTEESINEMLRQQILENRRIQQVNTIRKLSHSNAYTRR